MQNELRSNLVVGLWALVKRIGITFFFVNFSFQFSVDCVLHTLYTLHIVQIQFPLPIAKHLQILHRVANDLISSRNLYNHTPNSHWHLMFKRRRIESIMQFHWPLGPESTQCSVVYLYSCFSCCFVFSLFVRCFFFLVGFYQGKHLIIPFDLVYN